MANPFGFKAARHLFGQNTFQTGVFTVDDNNPKAIWIGQAVTLASGKVVEHTSTSTTPILGVVKATYTSTKNRPRTFSQPTSGPFIPMSTRAFVEVYTDPNIVFEVVANSAASDANIGHLCEIVASPSGNNKTGISDMQISQTTMAAQTSVNNQTLPFRVVGLAMRERAPAGAGYADRQVIEVVIHDHVYRRAWPV